jgi:hypothetical protein
LTAAYSGYRPDGVTAALGIHLVVYCAVGACFAFGLYALLQPSRVANPGVAEYKPPPGAVVRYGKPFLMKGVAEPVAPVAPIEPEPETTGRSTPQPELKPTVTAPSRPHTGKRPNRDVRMESPKPRAAACIPAYDSSGAQTRPCG